MQLDHAKNGQVRKGYPFSVACKTNGSDKLKVQWFKDGSPVVLTNALRPIAVTMQPADLRGFSTVYFEVKKATISDRGEYECRAQDWGQTVRKTVFLDVVTPPVLDLMPLNPTVFPVSHLHSFFVYKIIHKAMKLYNIHPLHTFHAHIIARSLQEYKQ